MWFDPTTQRYHVKLTYTDFMGESFPLEGVCFNISRDELDYWGIG
jgi:hypothetical protein